MPRILIPYIANAGTGVGGTGGPQGMAGDLFEIMGSDPQQKRPMCVWNEKLAHAAQAHAEDMLHRGYFSHMSPEHVWSNKRARMAGYKLPDWFHDDSNQIESIAGGYATVDKLWQAWLKSLGHRLHVLGEQSYVNQVNVGVGYAAQVDAPLFKRTWVLVSAPEEGSL